MGERKKKPPVGIEDFELLRRNDFYYVDKTGLIRDLLGNWGSVNLFTRPRRFGKTLNMSMLKSFFEIGGDKSIFDGLAISREEKLCEEHMGKYPVISISLKDVEGKSYEDAVERMSSLIREEARRHQYLLESGRLGDIDKESLKELYSTFLTEGVQKGSLRLLSEMLHKHYGRRVVILIDEYDVPLDKAHQDGYYEQMVRLIRSLLSQTLKTNPNLEFAVLTGCLRIARESIFTGLNNFKVRGIDEGECAEYFGFTDEEVRKMLMYYGAEDRFPDMKRWYDGYHFGDADVYCPWDVICQCDLLRISREAQMKPHWGNSSSNSIVKDILEDATDATKEDIEALISGGEVEKEIIPELTYADLDNRDATIRQTYLWSILYSTGYLTDAGKPDGRIHKLVIPNKEVRKIYEDRIRSWFRMNVTSDTKRWGEFCRAVKTGDARSVQELFNEFLSESISIRDTAVRKELKETFFHGLFLGLLRAEGSWKVKSNAESGSGYSDIILIVPREHVGCVIEVKYAEKGAFDEALRNAMEQIKNRDYASLLKQDGMETVHKYGLACYRKACRVAYEKESVAKKSRSC